MKDFFIKIFWAIIDSFKKKTEVIDNIPLPPLQPSWTPINEWDVENPSKRFGDYPLDKKKKLYALAHQVCLDKGLSPQLTEELLATIWGESSYNPFCQNENKKKWNSSKYRFWRISTQRFLFPKTSQYDRRRSNTQS